MLKSVIFSTLIVTIISLSFLCTNNIDPVSGVETGNPAMTACARTALSLLSNNSVWQPETYLFSGRKQLDPSSILPPQPSSSLQKSLTSTDTGSSTSSEKTIIIQRVDTIINVSKVFVNDTIIKTISRSDTSIMQNKAASKTDTTTIIADKLITTKIVAIDTIIVYDTFTVTHYDTIKPTDMNESTSQKLSSAGTKITITQLKASVSPVTKEMAPSLDITSPTRSYSVPVNYSSNTSEIYSKISRTGSIGVLNLSEEYTDGDGDRNLLSGATGSIPIVDLRANYALQNEQQSLFVRFDAGIDKAFSQNTDNRIHSLHRVNKINNQTGVEVTYTKIQSFSDIDSSLLTIKNASPDDSVASFVVLYSIINPPSPATPGANKLSTVQYTAQFQKGSYTSVTITVQPDSLPDVNSILSKAKLLIFIDFGKGSVGSFDGSIDYLAKQVQGTYSENGTEFDFFYEAALNESTFQIKN
jgi:hypothetical protein